jgi:carboxymethylenebutenolidase
MSELSIETPDGPMPAALAEPDGDPRGGVVVVQEAFGLTPHIVDITRRLAAEGWLAIAPALFHRQGAPVFDYGDYAALGPVIQQLTGPGIVADIEATIAEFAARGIPAARTGVVGFCMGGSVALLAASSLPVGAAVTFYGGGLTEGRFGLPSLLEQAPNLRAPWLGLYGDLDAGIPVEQVEALREATAMAAVPTEVVRYAGAEHGFNCNDRASFHPEAAADAWARMLAWFDLHLA